MKNTIELSLVLIIFVGFLVGCAGSGANENSKPPTAGRATVEKDSDGTSSPANASPPAVLNFSRLVGKNEAQIKAALGTPEEITKLNKTDKTGELSYDYRDAAENEYFINFKNKKADFFYYRSKKSYDTYFELGEAVGVNLRDVVPDVANSLNVVFKDAEFSGIRWYEVCAVSDKDGKYNLLTMKKTQ